MRILYGVVGEGMGHAIRSGVVLRHLIDEGHELVAMASDRAVDYLQKRLFEVRRIHGFHILYEENRVRRGRTLWSNILEGTGALPSQIVAYFDLINDFHPQVVISDFESWTWLYAKVHGKPVLSIDNMQVINRCRHPDELLAGTRTDFELTRAFIKSKLPFCHHYFISTFFRPELRKERTSLHPPILRPEILAAAPTRGDHLLVYQTAEGHDALVDVLRACGLECRIYGMRRGITEEQVEGRLRYRPFDERRFVEDLASARAVLAGGGFTLLGEAVFLHKPILSVPVRGQFEQVLNSRYVEREGFGLAADEVTTGRLGRFLEGLPEYEERLAGWSQDGNTDLFRALDEKLDQAEAGLLG
jgi:uncharacterized protein (TIGR00661 family)